MRIQIENHTVTLKSLTALQWLDLDLTEVVNLETGESRQIDPTTEYLKYLARKVSFAVLRWDNLPGITSIELEGNRSLHNIAHAISNLIDDRLEQPPVLLAERRNSEIEVIGDEFFAIFRAATIAELYESMARHSDRSLASQKVFVLAEMVLDWNGQGKVTGDFLLDDPTQHKYVLACDRALEPFFRKPKIEILAEEEFISDSDGNERREYDPASVVLVE